MDKYLQLLSGGDSVFIDGCARAYALPAVWIPLGLVLLYILLKNNNFKNFLVIISLVALLYAVTLVTNLYVCEPFVEYFFPSYDAIPGFTVTSSANLFINTADAFGIAIFLMLLVRHTSLTVTLTLWGIISCGTEIYHSSNGMPYIMAGGLFGAICGIAVYRIYTAYLNKKGRSRRDWISDRYTKSGYDVSDVYLLSAMIFATLAAVPIISFFLPTV